MATNGLKSSIPTLGMMRRRGARIGSVILHRIIANLFVGLGENQETITLKIITTVSTSHRILIRLRKNTNAA